MQGWNGSRGGVAPKPIKKKAITGRGLAIGVVVVILLVACAVVGVVMFASSDSNEEPVGERKESRIKEVKPQLSEPKEPKREVAVTNEVHRRLKPDGTIDHRFDVPPGSYRDERGILRRPGGMRILEAEPKHKVHLHKNQKPSVFKNPAERQIAALLTIEAGTVMIGAPHYGKGFLDNFKESLKTPIEILPTDDDETVALKQTMIETKKDLKERMEKGEDIVKVMQDTRDELQKIGKYRQDLNNEIIRYAREHDDCREQDIIDYVNAANMMLESRGATKKINVPKGLINHLKAQGKIKE